MGEVQVDEGMSGGIDQAQTEASFVRRWRVVAAMDMGNERFRKEGLNYINE